eukprot:gene30456-37674_t
MAGEQIGSSGGSSISASNCQALTLVIQVAAQFQVVLLFKLHGLTQSLSFKVSNTLAFAAVNSSGHVLTWGKASSGGDSSSVTQLLSGVRLIVQSTAAFAALKTDGSVVAWGETSSTQGSELFRTSANIVSLIANEQAFAGVTSSAEIFSTMSSFAALRQDSTVVTWGAKDTGGQESVTPSYVATIVSSRGAFVAVMKDFGAVSWGANAYGGNSSTVASQLTGGVKFIAHTDGAFAVLKKDGSVVMWGNDKTGGDASAVNHDLVNVTTIYSNRKAFAAVTNTSSVVVWGHGGSGGWMYANVTSQLTSGVMK